MSASLVGSEMCIRDSQLLDSGLLDMVGVGHDLQNPAQAVDTLPCRISRPVSYTHLTLPTICSV
eukprot:2636651-Alexandrium_andersonii.AAC.1